MKDSTNYIDLVEYYDFIVFFDQNLFKAEYLTTIKPTKSDLLKCLKLPKTFYNSFYIHALIKHYLMQTKNIDNELLREVCQKIFLNEFDLENESIQNFFDTKSKVGDDTKNNVNDEMFDNLNDEIGKINISENVIISEAKVPENTLNIDIKNNDAAACIMILEATKIIEKYTNYYTNKHTKENLVGYIHKLTNNILIQESFDLMYFPNFLEAFLHKNIVFEDHKIMIKHLLDSFGNNSIDFYMSFKTSLDDFNQNLDLLEIGLIALHKYLYHRNSSKSLDTKQLINMIQIDMKYIDETNTNEQAKSNTNSSTAPESMKYIENTYKNEQAKSNSNIALESMKYIENNYKNDAKISNNSAAPENTQVDFLNIIITNYNKLQNENQKISFSHEMFNFASDYYREMILQLKDSQNLENDLYLIFKTTFSIFMLSFDQSKYKQLFKVIEFVMLSKDLLIREDLMVDLIKHIITSLKKINNKEMSKLHLLLLLNTNAIIYLSKKSKNDVFLHLIDNEILSEDEKFKVIKETDYNVEVNLIFDIKNKTVKAESNIEIIAVFLEYLSFQSSSFYFNEYNTIFEKHMKHKNCIEFYANFLARNELESPLWNYLPNKEIEEAVNFFTVFFKKIKTNYDKKYKNSKKKKDFSELLEKHVISFCYFFLKQKNELLVPVLNTFPFLPCKHDYLYIYYDIWCFILNNEMIREVLFFAYKTPPFVNIAESFYTKHMPTQYLKGTIFRRYKKEVSSDSFSYENIEKHCSSFFMCIIYFVEYEKVRNFNFTGILAYIKDAELIKYCFNDFRYVLKLIHYKLKYNEEYLFLCEYTLCLLETFDYPFESTKVYILDILELLYKNYKMIVYDVNVNIKYNSVISSYYQSKTRNNVIFDRLVKFYKTCYIEVIKENSKSYYNYLLACVCDFSIFNEYSCFGKGRFLDLIKDANSKFYMINKFANTIKQEYNTCKNDNNNSNNNAANNINVANDDVSIEHSATPSLVNILSEFDTLLYAHENNKFTENVSWFIDVVYLYRNETSVLRKTIKILQKRLNILYNYDDLFVILKIYNILGIREEETDYLVKSSLSKGVDYNIDYNLLKQLSEQTEDFFTFYFYDLYFISSLNYNQDKFLNFPTKKTVFATFSKSDLIKIHNVYRRKMTFDLLNTSIFSHREYFVDTNSLSVMEILMILMFCSKKEFTEPALTELRNKDVLFYIPQIVQTLKKGKFFIEIFLVLMKLCKDVHVCHFLIWNLKSNLSKECEIFKRCLKDLEDFCMKQEGKSNENDRNNVRGINDRNYIGKNASGNMEVNNVGGKNVGDKNVGDKNVGGKNVGGKNVGGKNVGGKNVGGKNVGGKNVGGKNVGGKNVGGKNVDNVTFDSPYTAQMNFFSALTNVSSLMMPFIKREKEEKRKQINRFLSIVEQPKNVYLPTDPSYEILGIVPDSGKVLQSHAKVPFMASFYCRSFDTAKNNEVVVKNLIFKSGDDCRQDMLAIQLITLFKDIFKNANIDLFLFPYKVIATDTDSGIIEVIPNAITRDQMGREKINNLVEYFEFKYGYKEGLPFKKAVNNFTKSLAGYSLVTYFLNIADRHNGNIMIDDEGHIIHIDFGFMFEIAPGIGIEIPLKLTKEVYDLLSIGNMFEKYIDLMIKGFFALRRNSKDIIFMVDSFKDSGLPCYKKNAVENFIGRFKFGLNDDEAKTYVKSMITGSIRKVRTWVYDKFQEVTNNIAF